MEHLLALGGVEFGPALHRLGLDQESKNGIHIEVVHASDVGGFLPFQLVHFLLTFHEVGIGEDFLNLLGFLEVGLR